MSYKEVADAFERTKKLPEHFATLVAERPRGSTWGKPPGEDGLLALAWRDVTESVSAEVRSEGCRYYQAAIRDAFPDARVGALPLSQVDPRSSAVVAMGQHGPELVAPVSLNRSCMRTDVATLIIGPHATGQVVYTVHPGAPLAPMKAKSLEAALSLGEFSPQTAVKLVPLEEYLAHRARAWAHTAAHVR